MRQISFRRPVVISGLFLFCAFPFVSFATSRTLMQLVGEQLRPDVSFSTLRNEYRRADSLAGFQLVMSGMYHNIYRSKSLASDESVSHAITLDRPEAAAELKYRAETWGMHANVQGHSLVGTYHDRELDIGGSEKWLSFGAGGFYSFGPIFGSLDIRANPFRTRALQAGEHLRSYSSILPGVGYHAQLGGSAGPFELVCFSQHTQAGNAIMILSNAANRSQRTFSLSAYEWEHGFCASIDFRHTCAHMQISRYYIVSDTAADPPQYLRSSLSSSGLAASAGGEFHLLPLKPSLDVSAHLLNPRAESYDGTQSYSWFDQEDAYNGWIIITLHPHRALSFGGFYERTVLNDLEGSISLFSFSSWISLFGSAKRIRIYDGNARINETGVFLEGMRSIGRIQSIDANVGCSYLQASASVGTKELTAALSGLPDYINHSIHELVSDDFLLLTLQARYRLKLGRVVARLSAGQILPFELRKASASSADTDQSPRSSQKKLSGGTSAGVETIFSF